MESVKSLTYIGSWKVFYHSYKIVEHFPYRSYWFCFCDRYQGCVQEPFAGEEEEDYCCVCRARNHYSLKKLEKIKHGSFKLEKYYLNILRDLRVDPTTCFWEDEFCYQFRNWRTCLRSNLDFSFTFERLIFKSLMYSTPMLIFYKCYKIIQHFLGRAYVYCLCDRYQGFQMEGDYLASANFYCCVCQVYIHHTIDKLNAVKRDELKLTTFHNNILKDLEEIKKVEPGVNFRDEEVEFKFRN